jgi:hypothetical protein
MADNVPLVVQRLELLFTNLLKASEESNSTKYRRMSWILKSVFDEMADEMLERDAEELEQWLAATGQVIKWIGTGQLEDLPEKFHAMTPEHLLQMSKQPLALESTVRSD